MTQTHTPGPWIVARGDSVYARRGDGPLAPIADCNASRTVTAANRAANASLIAAAPDLLAEAKELLRNVTYADGVASALTQDCEALERAIAKAEGRS